MSKYLEILKEELDQVDELTLDPTSDLAKKFKQFCKNVLVKSGGKYVFSESDSSLKYTKDDIKYFFKYGLLSKKGNNVNITKKGILLNIGDPVNVKKEVDDTYFQKMLDKYKSSQNAKKPMGKWILATSDGLEYDFSGLK